jgi:hypothetical protein
VFAYFANVALDVDATRAQLAEARDRRLAEVRALRADAESDALRARERLGRVRRDYQDGRLDADDWAEQREQLSEEGAAAEASVKRLRDQEAEVGAWGELLDAERDTLQRLGELRRAIAGQVRDAEGLAAVRAALLRLFEGLVVHRADPGLEIGGECTDAICTPAYTVELRIREAEFRGFATSYRQQRVLDLLADGQRPEEVADIFGVDVEAVRKLAAGPLERGFGPYRMRPFLCRTSLDLAENKNQQATPQTFTT